MKAILVNGSPREDGNSRSLLDTLEAALRQRGATVERYSALDLLSQMKTPFCTHCAAVCRGACYRGTAVEEYHERIREADCLVAASPVYFGTVSAELKALWDLGRKTRQEHGLLYTVGAALAVGGGRFGGQETTVRAMHDMMMIQGMIVVGDSSPEGIGHQGVAVQDPSAEDTNATKRLGIMAEALVDISGATRTLRRQAREGCKGRG